MRDVKLVFAINHTIPYTEEYDNLVKDLFAGKIGGGSRVLPPLSSSPTTMTSKTTNCSFVSPFISAAMPGLAPVPPFCPE